MTNNQTPDCAICRIGGGVGNIVENLERAAVASSKYNIDSCFLYWRHGTPLVGESTLDELFDLKSIKCFKTKFASINDIQAKQLSDKVGRSGIVPRLVKYLTIIKDGQYLKKTADIEIATCDPELMSQLWREIRLSILVRKIADDFASANITPSSLGVHVRRTDNRIVPVVTTEKIFRFVDRLMEKSYNRIFLATDDSSEEKKFIERYGKLVVFTNKSTNLRWNTPGRRRELVTIDTYKEALIDMLVLGGCKTIVGSCASSFSFRAVKLSVNKSELIIAS